MFKHLLLLCFAAHVTLSSAQTLHAQDTATLPEMATIEAAWQAKDYDTVRAGLEILATQTDEPRTHYRYGRVLFEGLGGPVDIDGGVKWFERAAAENNTDALMVLAKVYLTNFTEQDVSTSLTRNPERAAELLSLAAALGEAKAQFELGRLYRAGLGLPADPRKAFQWFLAAANQENPEAQFALAQAYSQGLGAEKNSDKTVAWLTRAADNNHTQAQFALAAAYEAGNGVEQSPARAADWYRRAAEGGSPLGQRKLGLAYLTGNGAPQDPREAVMWLTRAAQAGDAVAMNHLGQAYASGETLEQSDETAALWYSRAAQYDLGSAVVSLAAMTETGRGVAQDFDAAIALYQKAITLKGGENAVLRLGQLAASGALGDRFAPGRVVPWVRAAWVTGDADSESWLVDQAKGGLRDAQMALAETLLADPARVADGMPYLHQAANGGDPLAQFQLGQRLMTGDGVDLDYIAAHAWFNIAATLGETDATALRDTVTTLMTPDDVAQAQTRARDWFANEEPQPPATDQTVKVISE
ncbi:MAG: TPR repeat protein [Yoonia sp.]|jgi:TPR repeat protein